MLRKCLPITATVSLIATIAASAHHGHDHHEPPASPPVIAAPMVVNPPPVVEVPAPAINFQLPVMSAPSTILPTDVTGFRAPAEPNELKQQPLATQDLAALAAQDPRFDFTGEWIPFSSDYSAQSGAVAPFQPVSFDSSQSAKHFGGIERTEFLRGKFTEPVFMPTMEAAYKKLNNDHVKLIDGAILVKAGERPVFVSTKLCDEQVITRISGGSIALVSAFEQKPTVLNLTDKCCGAVMLYLPAAETDQHHCLNLHAGRIAEAYRIDTHQPTSNLVATRIEVNRRIGKHCGLLVSQCNYLRAMKKFNLVAALPEDDFKRVLKTAAALQYARP